MLRLIVNADDFGYTPGVNQAILELHQAGALTSTTLMATGPALEDALTRLNSQVTGRRLGVGCHVVLVDGTPVSPVEEIGSLLGGPRKAPGRQLARFRPTLGSFAVELMRGQIRESEIEREAVAQIRLLQARGLHVTHLDTHKHTHMFPRVLRPLLRAALHCGVGAVRNPFEPEWSRRATPGAPLIRLAQVGLLTRLRPAFMRLVAEAGLRTTDGAIGVLATGTLDRPTLECWLDAAMRASKPGAPAGDRVWELVCHPGYNDAALKAQPTRLRAAREIEREALAAARRRLAGFELIHFGEP